MRMSTGLWHGCSARFKAPFVYGQEMITILPCQKKKHLTLFEQIPEILHRNNPNYVPSFSDGIVKIFDKKHPFYRHGRLYPFIAYKEGNPVGRIAAIINNSHNEYYKDKRGFFGFFDTIDNYEVASALFDTAKWRLNFSGFETVRGPYNPSINDESGLLLNGFDSPPFVTMPHNPPYYRQLYKKLGLKRACDLHAYYISAAVHPPEPIKRIVDRVKKKTGIQIRGINMKKLHDELKILAELYNKTLDRNWGFVSLTNGEMEYSAKDLKAIEDPDMMIIAEKNGIPVGFSLMILNFNEFRWKPRRLRKLFRILRFVRVLKTKPPREVGLMNMGVIPEFRNKGIAPVLYYEALFRAKGKYVGGKLFWIEESNTEVIKAIELMGGKKYKTYQIFEKEIKEDLTGSSRNKGCKPCGWRGAIL